MKLQKITIVFMLILTQEVYPQELSPAICSILVKAAIGNLQNKDHEEGRLLNRLVEKINPIDRIEKGWDEISGRNKTELPRQMTLYEIRKRGLQLQ